jgi:hypothetical protein
MGVAISETFVGRMSGSEFRSFQERRPDRERWELVAGVPMMMTPPTIAHNRIASNLERLLNDALDLHDPSRMAARRPGIELGSGDYRPEPDIGVIDADYDENQRFVARAYLLAEIVSGSDDVPVPGTGTMDRRQTTNLPRPRSLRSFADRPTRPHRGPARYQDAERLEVGDDQRTFSRTEPAAIRPEVPARAIVRRHASSTTH